MSERRMSLSVLQKHLLSIMARNNGVWPPRWRVTCAQRKSLNSLQRQGIITETTVTTALFDDNMDVEYRELPTWQVTNAR